MSPTGFSYDYLFVCGFYLSLEHIVLSYTSRNPDYVDLNLNVQFTIDASKTGFFLDMFPGFLRLEAVKVPFLDNCLKYVHLKYC
jgi:hypothetical protein